MVQVFRIVEKVEEEVNFGFVCNLERKEEQKGSTVFVQFQISVDSFGFKSLLIIIVLVTYLI